MLTAHDAYKDAHACLFNATTLEQIHQASRDTVENYLENRRIWDELNHYKACSTLLGKHPIFDWMKRLDEIRHMPTGDLVNLKNRTGHNLICKRSMLAKGPANKNTAKRLLRIGWLDRELIEVDRLLNM